jgi:hypothetical protein
MDYQTRLNRHLMGYKAKRLSGLEDGTWAYRGEVRSYAHILPSNQFQLNILPRIRDRFWNWFPTVKPPITTHQFFHHLNSSQALAFNLFFPFVDEATRRLDSRLLQALKLSTDLPYTGEFEKVLDRHENTNFDFYLQGSSEHRVFVEVKLSEREFGSCPNDERHRQKLNKYYRPLLTEHVDPEWIDHTTFFTHYQILRNLYYLARHPRSSLIFIFPKRNETLAEAEETIRRIVSRSLAPRVGFCISKPSLRVFWMRSPTMRRCAHIS